MPTKNDEILRELQKIQKHLTKVMEMVQDPDGVVSARDGKKDPPPSGPPSHP